MTKLPGKMIVTAARPNPFVEIIEGIESWNLWKLIGNS